MQSHNITYRSYKIKTSFNFTIEGVHKVIEKESKEKRGKRVTKVRN